MKKPPPAINLYFSLAAILALFFFAPLLVSCSDDPVALAATQSQLVFDWPDYESVPEQRLSVFVEFSSNVRRVELITVRHGQFVWNIENPVMIQAGDRQWAGASNLEPPPGENAVSGVFESGLYSVECVDAQGEKTQGSFSINYDREIMSDNAASFVEKGIFKNARVAVYSESNELLYFDVKKENWIDAETLFKGVKNSSLYRDVFMSGNLICFMPKIFKGGEKADVLE